MKIDKEEKMEEDMVDLDPVPASQLEKAKRRWPGVVCEPMEITGRIVYRLSISRELYEKYKHYSPPGVMLSVNAPIPPPPSVPVPTKEVKKHLPVREPKAKTPKEEPVQEVKPVASLVQAVVQPTIRRPRKRVVEEDSPPKENRYDIKVGKVVKVFNLKKTITLDSILGSDTKEVGPGRVEVHSATVDLKDGKKPMFFYILNNGEEELFGLPKACFIFEGKAKPIRK